MARAFVNGAIIEAIYICRNHELVDLENVNFHLLLPFESRTLDPACRDR